MKYIVYLTVNKVNNHIYVGVHETEDPNIFDGYIGNSIDIFKSNPELKNPKLPFHKAVKKYGYSAFIRNTILVFDTLDDALNLEGIIVNEEFIKRSDTYNVTLGGGMPPLHDKVVYKYSLSGEFIGEYKSLTEAGNDNSISGNLIGIAANYKRTANNYLWSFIKVDKLDLNNYNIYNPKIPVYLYDSDGVFIKCYESMSETCKDLNTYLAKIQRALKLGNDINGFYISTTLSSTYISPKIPKISGDIHLYDLNGLYILSFTTKESLIKFGFDIYSINRSIKELRTYKNFIWIRGEKLDRVPAKSNKVNKIRKIGQYTMEGDLVKIFSTLRDAKKEFPNVSKVLRGNAKHCHNFIFKYVE